MQKNVYILTNSNPNYSGLHRRCVTTLATDKTDFSDEELYSYFHEAKTYSSSVAADEEAYKQKCKIFPNTKVKIIKIAVDFDILGSYSKKIAIVLKTKGAMRLIAKNISPITASNMQKDTDDFSNFDKVVGMAKIKNDKLNDLMSSGLQLHYDVHVIDFSYRFFPGDELFSLTPKEINDAHKDFIDGRSFVVIRGQVCLMEKDLVVAQLNPIIKQSALDTLDQVLDGQVTLDALDRFWNWKSQDEDIVRWWKDLYQSTFENQYPKYETILMCEIKDGKFLVHALK